MDSCPKELEPFVAAHKLKLQEQDYMNWLSNQYTLSAVSVAVEHCFSGKKAKSKYIKEPVLTKALKNNKERFTEKDIEMAILTEKRYMAAAVKNGLPETIIK